MAGPRRPLTSSFAQATDRPLLGVNGLDMAGLRPFDLVIPFTIKKGEITGEGGDGRPKTPRGGGCPQNS